MNRNQTRLPHPDHRSASRRTTCLVTLAVLCAGQASAQAAGDPQASRLDQLQVSATRFSEAVQEVPNSIAVITAEDLAARGVHDLRGALAQLAGVTVGPGGDAGSASASPGMLGRRETDDFLLVVDGVPAGGAFTPQFATLNLHNVDRIEVIRGAAPVYYGTTAFAGTISVVHAAAGRAVPAASLSVGSFGSVDLSAAGSFSAAGVRQSVAVDFQRDGYADAAAMFRRIHGMYRAALDLGRGEARFDLEVTELHDLPASPTPFEGTLALLPLDFRQHPLDAHLDTRQLKATAAMDQRWGAAQWSTVLTLTHTRTDTVNGFLDAGFASETGTNASGYDQGRGIDDLFFDTHLNQAVLAGVDLTWGLNVLDGKLDSHSRQFAYWVPLDGSPGSASAGWDTVDTTRLGDHRSFIGVYAQSRWKVDEQISVLTGLRWNHLREQRDGFGDSEGFDHEEASQSRLSGSLGINWWLWKDASGDLDDLAVYANFGNTFQPPQVDFGPDAQIGAILKPETLQSGELGIKADGLDGRFDAALSAFFVRFANRPLTTTVNQQPAVVAGGQERFKGIELEFNYKLSDALRLSAEYGRNTASYGDFNTQIGGIQTQLAGNRIELVPEQLLGLGMLYAAPHGWQGSLGGQYQGARYLDAANTARAGGFTVIDASLGYRWKDWSLRFSGDNLGDRRDPVLASELGDSQLYRMNGRRLMVTVSTRLD